METKYFVDDVFKVVNWFRVKNFSDMRQNENVEPLTQMKVMKLLYYVQGVSLAAYDKAMFPDDILAWRYGPVVEKVYNKYRGHRSIAIDIVDDGQDGMDKVALQDYEDLSSNDKISAVLGSVEETYGDMSAISLMKQTHLEDPWKKTEQSGVINQALIKSYFKENILV